MFTELAPYRNFRDGLAAGELRYMQCEGCSQPFFYPRVVCPHCGGTRLAWRTSAGEGAIYSLSTIGEGEASYIVALVDLDEGFRVMSNVESAGEAPAIGDRVRARAVEAREAAPARIVFDRLGSAS
ncbi:DNA-binding protein [Devosia sp. D6-9]|nr:DNA-binding protein [Devosia sp. D6-9]